MDNIGSKLLNDDFPTSELEYDYKINKHNHDLLVEKLKTFDEAFERCDKTIVNSERMKIVNRIEYFKTILYKNS